MIISLLPTELIIEIDKNNQSSSHCVAQWRDGWDLSAQFGLRFWWKMFANSPTFAMSVLSMG